MPTQVLVFENDTEFAQELRRGLAQFGCETTIVDDASLGLQSAARVKPDLILLAIELPRMNGFSVCNRLKRDPGLKDVPLIITSSESSEETFEQHRRLRTRAEDYIHKPVTFDQLLNRIHALVPLGASSHDRTSNVDEIIVEDDIEIEDAHGLEGLEIEDAEILDLETDIERLADQAFESIQSQPPPDVAPEGEIEIAEADVLSEEHSGAAGQASESDALSTPPPLGVTGSASASDALSTGSGLGMEGRADRPEQAFPRSFRPSGHLSPRISSLPAPSLPFAPRKASNELRTRSSRPPEIEAQRFREELDRYRNRISQLEEEVRNGRFRIGELEDALRHGASKDHEVRRLQRELDEAKAKIGSNKGASAAREFLDLREQLNRKDKENLDLRDQLTHRDKELFAARDGLLALERERADLLDRTGELERLTAELQRRDEALRDDKEAAVKRADDSKRKFDKLRADLDAKGADYAELKIQFDAELANRSAREAELETRAQAELEKAVLTTEATERARGEQMLLEALERARAEHAEVLKSLQTQADTHREEAVHTRDAELTQRYEMLLGGLEKNQQETVTRLQLEHERVLAETTRAAAERLGTRESELEAVRLRELEAAHKEYDAERAAIEAAHSEALAERARTASGLERELALRSAQRDDARHDVERRDLRIEGMETDLSSVREKLEINSAALAERESALAALQSELNDKAKLASELETRLRETSQRLATVELDFSAAAGELEQTRAALARDSALLSRARDKWVSDKGSLDRSKDALAAALAQIDEIEARPLE